MTDPAPRFQGFQAPAFAFFHGLAAQNERAWFLAHKDTYDTAVKAPMLDLVADLSDALAARHVPLVGYAGKAMFRPNRDVRFSKDKSPYKTNAGAVLSRDGGRRSQGVLYVQMGEGGGFAAMGFYQLEPAALGAFRDQIVHDPAAWRRLTARLAKTGLALRREDSLTRLPRGYDTAASKGLEDDLRLKSFILTVPLTKAEFGNPALAGHLADFARNGCGLLEFGWHALPAAYMEGGLAP